MTILLIGAGRMGIRHAQGIMDNENIDKILIIDIAEESLNNAKKVLTNKKIEFQLSSEVDLNLKFDICIVASTAKDRIQQLKFVANFKPSFVLVEKPLGQSLAEIIEINDYVLSANLNCFVNLNMRLYDNIISLKNRLSTSPQLSGTKTITINTGTLGIGANGIHYLDLLYFLLDADKAKIVSSKIYDELIPSGRGADFFDFGGWSVIEFFKNNIEVGTALISFSNKSTSFGSWEILASNGRIWFNEAEQKCVYSLRKEDSQLPVNRYFGDYLPNETCEFAAPFLGDLTNKWVNAIVENNQSNLPTISSSIAVHELMFKWLANNTSNTKFPIT
jgi:predicted dehydrogenase